MKRGFDSADRTGVWAVVPAKNFRIAKSRLAPALASRERAALARAMLTHVLEVLGACSELAGVCVATDSESVAAVARRHGARVLLDAGAPGLGSVVHRTIFTLAERRATAAMIVMADLPELGSSDVRELFDLFREFDVVIAPDRHAQQTNALLLPLPPPVPTHFGRPRSLRAHAAAAGAAGLRVAIHETPSLGLDLDETDDLDYWRSAFPRRTPSAARARARSSSVAAQRRSVMKG